MKTRKTKKRNIIRRAVAFLLCMTMVLGLGMQDVIEQVYAEEAIPVIEQEAATEEAGELTTEGAGPEENAETAEEPDESVEEAEEQSANSNPSQTADAEENTETDVPSAPAENAGSEEGEKQNPSAPAEDGQSSSDSETSAETNPGGNTGNEITAPTEDGNTVTNPDETTGEDTEDDAAVSDEEEETTEPEEKVTELTYAVEDGSFSVKAAAVGEDTDLSGYELHAAQVQKDGEEADRYAAAEELVAGALDAESRQIEELQAYDIWFTYTENGETADLSGQVQISLEYTAPEFPEGTDAQLEVFCLNGGTAEAVDGTDALAAGCELYALAWVVPAESTDTWEWTDGQVIIKASAEKGVLPEEAEISVTPIVKTEEEELANLSEEERAEAEAINEQYDATEQKLNEQLQKEAAEEMEALAAESDSAAVSIVSESANEEVSDGAVEKTLKGFLSYDICFLNESGEEIEPKGEVNVSFEFNEAVVPEDVSENMEVAVKHFKEEEKTDGEKEVLVEDLTDAETTIIETESEDSVAVTKVELVADSFSEYTIIWYDWGPFSADLTVQVVDEEGNDVTLGNSNVELNNNGVAVSVQSIVDGIEVLGGYTFLYAKVGRDFTEAKNREQNVLRLRNNNDYNQYSYSLYNNDWNYIGYGNTIFFIYSKPAADIGTIDTVDSTIDGITLNLFDYDTDNINDDKTFRFTDGSSEHNSDVNSYHSGTDEDAVFDGIFERKMEQDPSTQEYTYPVFSKDYNSGEDASYLFSTTEEVNGKTTHANVNYLFTKDADGYYRYDSSTNFAYYDNSTNNFIVYDVPAAPAGTGVYMNGSFFPFNSLAKNSIIKDPSTGLRNFESGTGYTSKNTHFGMTMSATFVQPTNGKVNNQDMEFSFSGDDDVWVFIDGVLVLDIGGIHDALEGTINFNTGVVTVTGQQNTTLRSLFEQAGVNTESGFTGNTFSDYTTHTINFYYLERGEGTSNCKLEFNIQTLPKGDVVVEKQLGVQDGENTDTFTFKAETSADGISWEPLDEGTTFTISNAVGGSSSGEIGSGGTFTLQAAQRAIFSDIPAGTYFRATEAAAAGYTTSVTVNAGSGDWNKSDLSGWLKVTDSGVNRILFTNTQNSSSLLNYNKTAESVDCDDRVYEVTLNAGARGMTGGSEGEDASIVLVLDASKSIKDSGAFGNLKTAAQGFIDTAVEKTAGETSGDIEIAIVWYKGDQGDRDTTSVQNFLNVNDASNVSTLKTFIDGGTANGGTPMGDGLSAAQTLLQGVSNTQKYVLFFTDGRPGYSEGWDNFNCMVANDAYDHATAMKSEGVTIYTVGFGNDMNQYFRWVDSHSSTSYSDYAHGDHKYNSRMTGAYFLENYIASSGCAFTTYDATKLEDIFREIAGSVGSKVTVLTQKIEDVIDERFTLLVQTNDSSESVWTDGERNMYRPARNGDPILDTKGNKGTVSLENGIYTITWNDVTIANETDGGWEASFYVKAKEDFIGGNMITTNDPTSGIYLPDGAVINFPMPKVNVKLLGLQSDDKDVEYFKGESVNPRSFIQELLNTAEVVELVSENDVSVTIPLFDLIGTLSEEQLNTLMDGGIVEVDYKYGSTNDVVGSFQLRFAPETGKGDLTEHPLMISGQDVEQYVLTVTYSPKDIDTRKAEHSGWKEPAGPSCPEQSDISTISKCNVDVVAGSIRVQKTVSVEELRAALEASDSDKVTFSFTITGDASRYSPPYNNSEVIIEFTQNDIVDASSDGTITKQADVVTDLAQDIYTVRENAVDGFEVAGVVAAGYQEDGHPIVHYPTNDSSFTTDLYVGLNSSGQTGDSLDYLEYRDGVVTFTNEKVASRWKIVKVSASDNNTKLQGAQFELVSTTDSEKKYVGTSDVDGIVSWTKDGAPVDKLEPGIYTLKETQAPEDYSLSSEEWTVEIAASGALKSIKDSEGNDIKVSAVEENGTVVYYYTDVMLYDLPSAGGPGIYLYMLGGVALMIAGTLLVYKKRKEEVLRS